MRPIIALALSAGILLGVKVYLEFAASARGGRVGVVVPETAAHGKFSVEITLTFDAQADDFSLEPVAAVLRLQDKTLLRREGLIPAGESLQIDDVPGLVEGVNEFYFECTPKDDGRQIARAVRLRVKRDDVVVADQTLWADAGQTPRGVISMDVPVTPSAKAHDHPE